MNYLLFTLFIGVGATAVMDLWGLARKPLLGIAPPNYALVGRWIAHMTHGRFRHDCHRGVCSGAWRTHHRVDSPLPDRYRVRRLADRYLGTRMGSAADDWSRTAVGIGTVAAPFLLMQPGMGAGIAASRTPRPGSARLQSLITHAVFGLGLYATGRAVHLIYLL